MSTGHISVYFPDDETLRTWLIEDASSNALYGFTHYSHVERPKRTWKPIADSANYRQFVHENDFSGHLFARGFNAMFMVRQFGHATLSFYDERKKSMILPRAERILESLAAYQMRYGNASLNEEHDFRNFHCTDNRRSGGMRGQDLRRYIPGLYWLNFFSHSLIEERQLDIDRITAAVKGTSRETEHGVFLKICDRPEQWFEKKDLVSRALLSIPGFFSMARVPRPPKANMTPRERLEYAFAVGDAWP